MINKRIISAILLASMATSLCGCSKVSLGEDAKSYPLVPALTESEVIDYYAESLSFDSVVKKNLDVQETVYEMRAVKDEAKKKQVLAALANTQKLLTEMNYKFNEANNLALQEDTFHFIKAYLNDVKLGSGEVGEVKQALGYYFVDVSYPISARVPGEIKAQASMIGLHGAFVHNDYYDSDSVDSAYMQQAATKLNEYYKENKILNKKATFTKSSGLFSTDPSAKSGLLDFTTTTVTENAAENTETAEPEKIQQVDEQGNPVVDEQGNPVYVEAAAPVVEEEVVNTSAVLGTRSAGIDVHEFNEVVGSSIKQSAYMPELSLVYTAPAKANGISGMGIYPTGIGGLTKFGYNRNQMAGTVKLRYVYKEDLVNPNILYNTNIYPVFAEVNTGFSSNNDNLVPEFLMVEFEKLIERSDRALSNCDLPALMSGDIYSDMGVAINRGYKDNYTNVSRVISTVRRVISRDVNNSAYLIEVESQIVEGPKAADVSGTYRDKSYVVIEQVGQKFVITDWLTITREMQEEPAINPDSAIAKRLVALNLAGDVSEDAKAGTTEVLEMLYKASTARVLHGPKTDDAGNVTFERGMYECFNQNTEMLSSTKLEKINSELRSLLVKHGTGTPAKLDGVVTEWIGGADNQVEFTTEEIITYTGRNDGIYMTCYYLMSKMEDTWVIDDLQILSMEEHSGETLQSDINRISAN